MIHAEFDKDGYPTEETEKTVREWPIKSKEDCRKLLEFVRGAWKYDNYFVVEGDTYLVSTGGWSGNEDLVGALMENTMFWFLCWYSSKRGGHYEFRVGNE